MEKLRGVKLIENGIVFRITGGPGRLPRMTGTFMLRVDMDMDPDEARNLVSEDFLSRTKEQIHVTFLSALFGDFVRPLEMLLSLAPGMVGVDNEEERQILEGAHNLLEVLHTSKASGVLEGADSLETSTTQRGME